MDLDQLERALRNADAAGDTDAARQLAQAIVAARGTQKQGASLSDIPAGLWQQTKDAAGGLMRGAGSIGSTLLAPMDIINAKMMGRPAMAGNEDRRQSITEATRSLGANPDSMTYGAGKLGSEIAGTAGMGSALSGLGGAIPGLAQRAGPALDAIRTAGFSAGGATGLGGLGARTLGGAITGGASAGLVSPEDAAAGAIIGGVLPGALQLGSAVGGAAGRMLRGPEQAPQLASAIEAAQRAGYVIPPTQANASLGNRLLEGMAGKISTAQNASALNQGVTNKMAARSLGLAEDTTLTPEVLTNIRKAAGQAYDSIGKAGTVVPGPEYAKALDEIAAPHMKAALGFPGAAPSPVIKLAESLRSESFDAGAAVAKIKELRSAADDAFRTGNTDIGRASKKAATALEDALDKHLQATGATDLLQQFRDARKLIAKTYSVEKALNPASGSVDARKLGQQLTKGKPLSGELADAATFGLQFPKAAQAVDGMGSLPQTSPLDWALAGGMTAATSNPLGMAGLLARPAARSLALSPLIQSRLRQSPGLLNSLPMDDLARFGLLSGPVMAAD